MQQAEIIALTNNKGGVGKTSVSVNLAGIWAKKNKRVLIIDLDQQCNASRTILGYEGFDQYANQKNAGDLFDRSSQYEIQDLIVKATKNLHIIPGKHNDLFLLEKELDKVQDYIGATVMPMLTDILSSTNLEERRNDVDNVLKELKLVQDENKNWTKILKKRLSTVMTDYDYIIIDLPPSVSRIPVNAWVASDILLVPVSDVYALDGIVGLVNRMVDIMRNYNENLRFIFFFNKVPVGRNQSGWFINKQFQEIMTKLDMEIQANPLLSRVSVIMDSYIRYSRDIDISNARSEAVVNVFGNSSIAEDLEDFAVELEKRISNS